MNNVQPTTAEKLPQEEIMKRNKEMTEKFLQKWKDEKENPISRPVFAGMMDDLRSLSVKSIFDFPPHIKGIVLFFILFACGKFFWSQTLWSTISIVEAFAIIMIFIVIPSVRSLASQLDDSKKVAKIIGTSPIVVSQKAKKENSLKKYLQLLPLWKSVQSTQKEKQAA